MEKVPSGIPDFNEDKDDGSCRIGKTPIIHQVLRRPFGVLVIDRPCRSGKSADITMLDAYLNIKNAGGPDRFSDTKLSRLRPDDPEKNSNHVIMLNFERLEASDFDAFLDSFRRIMADAYRAFPELDGSEKITKAMKRRYSAVTTGTGNLETLYKSVMHLCTMIESHHGKKPIVLIDGYDLPLNGTCTSEEDREKISRFLGSVLRNALASNDSLRFAVLVGTAEGSKSIAFLEANYVDIHDVLPSEYGSGEVAKHRCHAGRGVFSHPPVKSIYRV